MKPKGFLENNLTICANLILLGILRSKSASLEDWNSHVKPLSPTHTRPVCLPGSKSPRKPMNQVTAFWIKSNSRDRIRPQMQISPDTFPSCPAPLDFITSLYLSLSISRFAFTGGERQEEKDDSIFDFKEIKEIDKQKEAKLLHTQHTRSRKIFKCIPNKWKPLSLKIVLISALVEKRVKRGLRVMLRIILSRCQKRDGFRSE